MRDHIDDMIRGAMKSLDGEAPSGYFEHLPEKTLARLEASMQSGSPVPTEPNVPSETSVPHAPREEDSGLHDIRGLAQSARMRAARRGSTNPPISDDAIVAATSGAWNAVALPEPAKMVSLPEVEDLPPAKQVLAKEQAFGARFQGGHPQKRGKGLYAALGLVLAAAAGVTIYMMTQPKAQQAPAAAPAVAMTAPTPAPAPQPAPAPAVAAPTGGAEASAPPADSKPEAVAAAPEVKATPEPTKSTGHKTAATKGKHAETTTKAEPETKKAASAAPAADKPKKEDQDPSFDALLKEAGVDDTKKVEKPKLDKKELSGDDFKRGIGAVAKKAQACYKSTQGTAVVKLTIAPSGSVSKVTVAGAFAGTPEGDCVQKAVQGATFPPWDGGPQSFTYSYLLSE